MKPAGLALLLLVVLVVKQWLFPGEDCRSCQASTCVPDEPALSEPGDKPGVVQGDGRKPVAEELKGETR